MLSSGWPSVVLPLAVLIALIAVETPIAFALGLAGALGLFLNGGFAFATATLGTIPYDTVANYDYVIIPMFILMGTFIANSGMLKEIFDALQRRVARIPGGVAVATIISCTFFGGITGSSVADAATFGRLSIGEMNRRGYEIGYAGSVVASASTVAVLIPPSITLIIYAVLTQQSVNQLILAGLLPGAITVCAYIVTVLIAARRSSERRESHAVPDASGSASAHGWRETVMQAYGIGTVLLLFIVVVGGIYAGIYTSTEAGATGALAALVLSLGYLALARRNGRERIAVPRFFGRALKEAASLSGMIFALLIGAAIFTDFLVLAQVPTTVAKWVTSLPIPSHLVVALLLLVLIPFGMVMEGLSLLLVVAPIVYPIITALGYNGIWFGVLLVQIIEIGLIAPPLGLNVYAVSGMVPGMSPTSVFRRIPRFILAQMAVMVVVFVVPQVTTLIPHLSGAK
jgi:C4-dicarboxylate transporter, DctM subunit